jgi:hypothetical protein
MGLYCGIDWAGRHHDVALVEDAGEVLWQSPRTVETSS